MIENVGDNCRCNGFSAILDISNSFLGCHLMGLFTFKPHRRTRIEETERRFLLPESEEETKGRYGAAWKRYRRLRVAFPLVFLGWLPFGYIGGAVFRFFGWNTDFLMMLILAWIPFMSIFTWQWAFWQCPRCGYAFRGLMDPFFPKQCHHCDLPMWAVSSDE